ncbi:MAG: hypothetical protein E7214_14455 [Clostridium sp.]|nr:hypothetical protein [Clostridium sp.]
MGQRGYIELGFSDVVDGTVYTILVRLEKNKLVEVTKKKFDMGSPRKFYTLNGAGYQRFINLCRHLLIIC